ncbi:hypothetical protein COOONC_19580 [Cooperia oncophora]
MRKRFVARLLAFVVAVIIAVALIHRFRQNAGSERIETTPPVRVQRRSLIEKSVLLRYGDTDPLTIFSAFSHSDRITVILAAYGYLMRRIFCRLFDEEMQEVLPAGQSVVFPEFTVRCPPSDKARFVALSLNADDRVPQQDMHGIRVENKGENLMEL